MTALLKPLLHYQEELIVELLGRTGGDKIKVQSVNKGAPIFAADRFRLYDVRDRSRRITAAEFDALPWQGKGPDPKTATEEQILDFLEAAP